MSQAVPGVDLLELDLLPGERWWGGAVADGQAMPFGSESHERDLGRSAGFLDNPAGGANQSAPLLLSDQGRYVWSERPFRFAFAGERMTVHGTDILLGSGAEPTLRGSFLAASAAHFPASGAAPARAMFTGPQYNTWMEMPYAPTQDKVLAYVRGLMDAGFPPGLVMIDDRWSQDYGTWLFDRAAFPDPKAMVAQLHEWGFTVMLWAVPFVSPDSETFRQLQQESLLVRGADGEVAIRAWWNGYSAVLDLTNSAAVAWLHDQLGALVTDFGIDGFKFDAGDLRDYRFGDITAARAEPADQCEAWARFGSGYPFNEFRSSWKMGGTALAQRLHDKPATWDSWGLVSLIPESIAQGLIGHSFVCPDMVGGGSLGTHTGQDDSELFVRYAQCAALHPMMQFSAAPDRVLDAEHLAAVLEVVQLRQQLIPEIMEMVADAAVTGEPVLRSMAYDFPAAATSLDQFTLAGRILVAPVLEKGATSRRVRLPAGRWSTPDGATYQGPTEITIPVALRTLPWFRREIVKPR